MVIYYAITRFKEIVLEFELHRLKLLISIVFFVLFKFFRKFLAWPHICRVSVLGRIDQLLKKKLLPPEADRIEICSKKERL
jgi:hypothetical protein